MRNKTQKGGRHRLLSVMGTPFQGVEVLILYQQSIVLFRTSDATPSLGLPGGRCDTGDGTLEHTIERELYEESKKSLFISRQIFNRMSRQDKFIDYVGDRHAGLHGMRRCYVCRIPFLSPAFYDTNRNIMELLVGNMTQRAARAYEPFFETADMVLVPLRTMDTLYNRHLARQRADVGGIRIQQSAWKAYGDARRLGLLQQPFVMPIANYSQVQNDNIYRGAMRVLRGMADKYR